MNKQTEAEDRLCSISWEETRRQECESNTGERGEFSVCVCVCVFSPVRQKADVFPLLNAESWSSCSLHNLIWEDQADCAHTQTHRQTHTQRCTDRHTNFCRIIISSLCFSNSATTTLLKQHLDTQTDTQPHSHEHTHQLCSVESTGVECSRGQSIKTQ